MPLPLNTKDGWKPTEESEGHRHGKNVQHRYRGKPLLAASEGQEGGQRERREALRERGFGALLAQVARRRVPQDRTNGDRHHNPQAPAGALVRAGGPSEGFVRRRYFQAGASQREVDGEGGASSPPAGSSKSRPRASASTREFASTQASAKPVRKSSLPRHNGRG